jgi:hypothetical protein
MESIRDASSKCFNDILQRQIFPAIVKWFAANPSEEVSSDNLNIALDLPTIAFQAPPVTKKAAPAAQTSVNGGCEYIATRSKDPEKNSKPCGAKCEPGLPVCRTHLNRATVQEKLRSQGQEVKVAPKKTKKADVANTTTVNITATKPANGTRKSSYNTYDIPSLPGLQRIEPGSYVVKSVMIDGKAARKVVGRWDKVTNAMRQLRPSEEKVVKYQGFEVDPAAVDNGTNKTFDPDEDNGDDDKPEVEEIEDADNLAEQDEPKVEAKPIKSIGRKPALKTQDDADVPMLTPPIKKNKPEDEPEAKVIEKDDGVDEVKSKPVTRSMTKANNEVDALAEVKENDTADYEEEVEPAAKVAVKPKITRITRK